jgi:PAS domain S-box-containing protein
MSLPRAASRRTCERAIAEPAHAGLGDAQVRALLDQLPAMVYISDAGVLGTWHYVSAGIRAILGFSPEEWMADPRLWARQVHPDDRASVFGAEEELRDPDVPAEYRMCHRDGRTVWVRDEAVLVEDEHGRARWHGFIADITKRKVAEAEVERRAEQQAAVARLGKHALRGADVEDLMHEALEEARRITGAGAVLERDPASGTLLVRAGGLDATRESQNGPARPAECLPGELPDGVVGKIEGRTGMWGLLWLSSASEPGEAPIEANFVQALANILADSLHQRAIEDDIRYRAIHDPLTGLPNRVLFLDRLATALSRRGAEVAVVLLDIDPLQTRQRQPRARCGR